MKIYIGADHRGFALKNSLKKYLENSGHSVFDVGNSQYNPQDDYPDFAKMVADSVLREQNVRGIVICGGGAGVCIGANRIKGIRAVLAFDSNVAKVSRRDDDTNVLCTGSDFLDLEKAKEIVLAWLSTPFSGADRYIRRIKKLDNL